MPARATSAACSTAGTGGSGSGAEKSATGLSVGLRLFSSVVAQAAVVAAAGFRHVGAELDVDRHARRTSVVGARSAGLGPRSWRWCCSSRVVALGLAGGARRSGHVAVERGYWLLALCSGVAIVTLIITPIDVLGLTPHKIRYLWVIGAFATYLLVMSILCRAARRRAPGSRRRARRGRSDRGGRHDPRPCERRRTGVLPGHVRLDRRHPRRRWPTTSPTIPTPRRRSASTPEGSGSPSRTRRR